MNLSLYMLLTAPVGPKTSVRDDGAPRHEPRHLAAAAAADSVRPFWPYTTKKSARPQASRCLAALEPRRLPKVGKLGFAAGVVFNAAGYLLLTTGLLLLLQVAQVSLN